MSRLFTYHEERHASMLRRVNHTHTYTYTRAAKCAAHTHALRSAVRWRQDVMHFMAALRLPIVRFELNREDSMPKPATKRPAAAEAGITEASLKSKGQAMTLDEKIALARSRSMTADQLGDELSGDDYKKSPPHCLSLPYWLDDQMSAQPAPANPTERVSTHD